MKHLRKYASAESDLAAAELIYAELVTNVIRHTAGKIVIVLEWRVAYAVLCVRDYGPGFEHDLRLPHSHEESGRGLFIVQALAKNLEIQGHSTGSEARATLPV